MEILFLGTGAADWELKPENEMKENERRYSSMLIDGKILLDVAPQSFDYAEKLGIDFEAITDCLITHTHGDHYNKTVMLKFAKRIGHKINMYCNTDAIDRLALGDYPEYFNIVPLNRFDKFVAGDYEITAVDANHLVENSPEQPLHYIFTSQGKTYMLGGDGGMYTAHTWEYMRTLKFDVIIFDATVGDSDCDWRLGTHNSIPMIRLIVAAMREAEMISSDTVLVANHLAKTLHAEDEETERIFAQIGIKVAYDGKTIVM